MTNDGILICPQKQHLESYATALARGFSPNTLRPEETVEELKRLREDPELLLASMDDLNAEGPPIILPDGRKVDRLPSIRRFIWDGEFCGIISLRWPKDGGPLPDHVPGHVGYAVVPWRWGKGLATRALAELLALAPSYGLAAVEVSCSPDNPASIRVIEKNGGILTGQSENGALFHKHPALQYRITL